MIPGALTDGQSNLVHGTQDLKMADEPIVMVAMPNCNEPTLKWPRRVPLGEVAAQRALTGGIEAFYRRLVGRGWPALPTVSKAHRAIAAPEERVYAYLYTWGGLRLMRPGRSTSFAFLNEVDSCSANGFPIGIGDGWVARQRASDVRSPRAIGTGPLNSLRPGEKTSSRDRCSPSRRACRSANC
jgi:hypothetical protein